jgi:AmmeMemoRadiSam system protein A
MLLPAEEKLLLQLARDTLASCLNRQTVPPLQKYTLTENLREKCGVFVTLKEKKNNELRGCIGYTTGYKPLAEAVIDCTVYAAIRDMRFQPMRAGEEKGVFIEISVLSLPQRVTNITDIRIGTHGLILSKGVKTGLLLPQVPVEQHWNSDAFLQAVCRKAELPDRAWEQGAELSLFTAQVFSENSPH